MKPLNFNHLRYFWAVAHAGGLTRAAEQMNLSQSALSVQLGKLEQQIGHRLFDRVGRRLELTEAGRMALDYADSVFRAGDQLLGALRGGPAAGRRELRVGALTTLSRNFQLEFLRPLMRRDDVDLVLRSGATRELMAGLETHSLDVVLTDSAHPAQSRVDLRAHVLDQQPVSLVGRPRAGQPPLRFPADLATEPILLPGRDSGLRLAFDRLMADAGVTPIIAAEVDDMAMLRLLARERVGLALVAPIVVRDEMMAGSLVEHHRLEDITETFYAIVQRRRFPNSLLCELLLARGITMEGRPGENPRSPREHDCRPSAPAPRARSLYTDPDREAPLGKDEEVPAGRRRYGP